MRRLTALLVVAILLVGCASAGDATSETPGGPPPGSPTAGGSDRDGASGEDQLDSGSRRVIYRASLQLQADDTRSFYDEITVLTETLGGFVASANVYPTNSPEAQPTISMVIRVPASDLTTIMGTIKDMSDGVVSESKSAQDVSEQFVDLEARLTNLRALETELRAMLTEVRGQPDADPEKVLRVFNELAMVRGQIEQIEGQLNHLRELTDLASLEIGITQSPAVAPIVKEPWAPAEAVRAAASDLVSTLQSMANWMISFVIYTLPVLILTLAVPAVVGLWAYRKWFRRRPTGPAAGPGLPSES
jgi:hypothetical protein